MEDILEDTPNDFGNTEEVDNKLDVASEAMNENEEYNREDGQNENEIKTIDEEEEIKENILDLESNPMENNASKSNESAAAPESSENKNQSIVGAATSQALRPFVIISSSYLLFTITDGAIRMIVLLHAYNKSFSAFEVAIMFTLYELAGVFTNLVSMFLWTNEIWFTGLTIIAT